MPRHLNTSLTAVRVHLRHFSNVRTHHLETVWYLLIWYSIAIVKLFYARRNPDPVQKKQILSASDVIASIMINHLKAEIVGEESRQRSPNMIIDYDFR